MVCGAERLDNASPPIPRVTVDVVETFYEGNEDLERLKSLHSNTLSAQCYVEDAAHH